MPWGVKVGKKRNQRAYAESYACMCVLCLLEGFLRAEARFRFFQGPLLATSRGLPASDLWRMLTRLDPRLRGIGEYVNLRQAAQNTPVASRCFGSLLVLRYDLLTGSNKVTYSGKLAPHKLAARF